ncbi:MAG TPA: hypothetical protein VNB86_05325 [Gaiellaceae bacterium]|jgi:hypothetical protein|nr:hypothetical protein [Gaiellaceae bacterium]
MGRQAVALAALVLVASGCQIGDSGDSDKDAFIQQADGICQRYAQRIGGIPRPQTFLRDFAVYLQRAVPIARQQNAELEGLTPPDDVADDFQLMLSLLTQQLDLAEQAGKQAYAGREARAQALYQQSLQPAGEGATVARRIGFTVCGNPR